MPRVMYVQSFYSFSPGIAQTALSSCCMISHHDMPEYGDGIGGGGSFGWVVLRGGVLKQYINWIEFDWKSPFLAVSK